VPRVDLIRLHERDHEFPIPERFRPNLSPQSTQNFKGYSGLYGLTLQYFKYYYFLISERSPGILAGRNTFELLLSGILALTRLLLFFAGLHPKEAKVPLDSHWFITPNGSSQWILLSSHKY